MDEALIGTDPLLFDTDGDGNSDGVDDFDGDGISNAVMELMMQMKH